MSKTFEIGEQFEKFLEENVFLKEDYDLIHRTNTYEQNKNRYAEETMRPDLKFRDKKSGAEFYVEAKYRSRFNNEDMVEVLSQNQFVRFMQMQKEESPIVIVIGCGGKPYNPETISLIPLDELKYLKIYKSVIRKYEIPEIPLRKLDIDIKSKHNESVPPRIVKEQARRPEGQINQVNKEDVVPPKKSGNKALTMFAFLIAFILGGWFISNITNNSNQEIESQVKKQISSYYKLLEGGSVDVLDQFVYDHIERWYSKINISFEDVKKDFIRYRTKYPDSKANVKWETFQMEEIAEGRYRVQYQLDYSIKFNKTGNIKQYDLLITAIWGDDLKIRSMYEEKI